MAFVYADCVQERTTAEGAGPITLAGVPYEKSRAFNSVLSVGDRTCVRIVHETQNEWEVSVVQYSAANVLARETVLASSNANAPVNFSSGSKRIYITQPAVSLSLRTVQKFEAIGPGVWTRPVGCRQIKATAIGGGGAGAGASGTGSTLAIGGSGGSGAVAVKLIDVSAVSSIALSVGAGANGTTGAGASGGTTNLGSYMAATGGQGGSAAVAVGSSVTITAAGSGSGGNASGGDLNFNGGRTVEPAIRLSGTIGHAPCGGDTPLGYGFGGRGGGNIGSPGAGYGAGGGGAVGVLTAYPGGNGADGAIIIEEFY